MLVRRLQHDLEHLYDLHTGQDIGRFLCTDPALPPRLIPGRAADTVLESLFLSGDSDNIDVTLYLQEALLQDLETFNPLVNLSHQNIDKFWVALEGVSHFVYFIWNCLFQRPVSLLEMELQAEVDKYLLSLRHLSDQRRDTSDLHSALFERCSYESHLSEQELGRYRAANDHAARYCRWLQDVFISKGRYNAVTREIRRFYRLPHRRKLDYINTLVG